MSYLESDAPTSTFSSAARVQALTSTAHRRGTSLIAPPSAPAKPEPPAERSPLSKAPALVHRRSRSLNLACGPYSAPAPASSFVPTRVPRSRPLMMLAKINTSRIQSPDRPSRRPHGPRSAHSPASSVSSVTSATRTHYHDIWKAKAGPSTIRTSPPQTSLPYDAHPELDPLFNIVSDQYISQAPRRYCLKLVDIDPLSSDDDSPFDSLFSFTASPVESPSYTATTFTSRQTTRPAPLSLHKHSCSDMSFFSPMSPEFVIRPFSFGGGDKVDRWIHGGGLEPLMTPMIVDHKPHEHWDEGGQSDWREIIDQFLQHAEGDVDEPPFPLTPGPGGNAR